MPPEGLLQLSGDRFHAPAVSHFTLEVLPEQLIRRPQILRQTLQDLCTQFLRHPIKGFGDAAGDAGKGVAVAAQRDRIAKCILYIKSRL